MTDRIFLRDLRVETIIGVFEWERDTRQTVCIDLTMPGDTRRAAASDHIDDTLNYHSVAERVRALTENASFQLVETLAERIAELCITDFDMPWVEVRVNKPGAVKGAQDVGVSIRRGVAAGGLHEVYVALGSNVDPYSHLPRALTALAERFGAISRSTAYRNPAVDVDGPAFINLVVGFVSDESPVEVAAALRDIDRRLSPADAPTALGLHLLLHGNTTLARAELTLPHPGLGRYAFMLRPLAELAGHRHHPITGERLQRVLAAAGLDEHSMQAVDL